MRTYDSDGFRYIGKPSDLMRHGDKLAKEIRPELWLNTKEYVTYTLSHWGTQD